MRLCPSSMAITAVLCSGMVLGCGNSNSDPGSSSENGGAGSQGGSVNVDNPLTDPEEGPAVKMV